mmetsp:Transcript_30925/g.53562  ORF Transcript_30925/g.53562 Transcript_30925/m.53562 type:complete len:84 (-) Transcript_30925:29-280(-)
MLSCSALSNSLSVSCSWGMPHGRWWMAKHTQPLSRGVVTFSSIIIYHTHTTVLLLLLLPKHHHCSGVFFVNSYKPHAVVWDYM